MKYFFAMFLFIFYGYIAFSSGVAVAIVLFIKMLGLTIFYILCAQGAACMRSIEVHGH